MPYRYALFGSLTTTASKSTMAIVHTILEVDNSEHFTTGRYSPHWFSRVEELGGQHASTSSAHL
jgi:hypothetical protein